MQRLRNSYRTWLLCGIATVVLAGLSPAPATAQSVKGVGVTVYEHGAVDGANWFEVVSVNAWLDRDGNAQGKLTWEGDNVQSLPGTTTNPSNPYIMDVLGLYVDGNTASVFAVVIASPQGEVNGSYWWFTFTDNSGTGQPDEVDNHPISAGHITVRD
jgi:hypothetical protein